MILGKNEIIARAINFSTEWKDAHYEKGEAQSFYEEFFRVFGIKRRNVAEYERHVRRLNDRGGFIDLFWPSVLLAEHKSAGSDLDEAMGQADEYFVSLDQEQRPRYMMACDFQNFYLIDLDERKERRFSLYELSENIDCLEFMRGVVHPVKPESPVSVNASYLMGQIHDGLKRSGYGRHDMGYLLTRLTYCLFADYTGIFDKHNFQRYIKNRTSEDGSDLGAKLVELFYILNTSVPKRQSNLDSELDEFPYVDGNLFMEHIDFPAFNAKMRDLLIEALEFDWSRVSPAIFGSLLQSVMDKKKRREEGAHYTTESNIMRVIGPLFLDDLTGKLGRIMSRRGDSRTSELKKFQKILAGLKFLDPACGSGNFLVVAYREIRKLEHRVIRELHDPKIQMLDVSILSKVDVDQFYGIEMDEFSSRIAETALWMMDHIMNVELGGMYGQAYARIPLKKHPNIANADALEMDWNSVLPASECSYVLGNPPFGGARKSSNKKRMQVRRIVGLGRSSDSLDYVAAWLFKAGGYVGAGTPIGFVATNSITQGEQVGQLWPPLFDKYGLEITFAHRPFKWGSEARGIAKVIVVIVGLKRKGAHKRKRRLFHHEGKETVEEKPAAISPYLVGSDNQLPIVMKTSRRLNDLPMPKSGSQPIDGGHYIFTDYEKERFLSTEPRAAPLFRQYVNGYEFLRGRNRWILDLHDEDLNELHGLPGIIGRIQKVKKLRLESERMGTRKLAETAKLFQVKTAPMERFLAIPRISSEKREYVPMGYMDPPNIPSDDIIIVEKATIGLFGILTSKMHMLWLRTIGGRLKSDLRYSIKVVYNTFPVPWGGGGCKALEPYAQKILDVRAKYPGSTLKDLYHQDAMPTDLKRAHMALDRATEKLYRNKPFESDSERLKHLLDLYSLMKPDIVNMFGRKHRRRRS